MSPGWSQICCQQKDYLSDEAAVVGFMGVWSLCIGKIRRQWKRGALVMPLCPNCSHSASAYPVQELPSHSDNLISWNRVYQVA